VSKSSNPPGRQSSIDIQVAWRRGVRTPAWDALWRQIVADLSDAPDQPLTEGGFDNSVPEALPPTQGTGEV
jgi:hypothetical protein